MLRGGYRGYDSDEEYDLRQQEFMFPWEHSMARRDLIDPDLPSYKDYGDNAKAFRHTVRRTIHEQDVNGRKKEEKYGQP